jgi:hypothetical protein
MSKPVMPQVDRRLQSSGEGLRKRQPEWVEVAGAVTAVNLHSAGKVLYRKPRWIKFNGDVVVTC